jgi:ABC-type microcin C transport system permease subunit YejB
MSRKELVFIVSRAFALLLTTWALAEVSYLPERVFALTHHISQSSVLARYDYWSSYYLVVTSFLVARVLALLLAAGSFWRCGPWVQALFSAEKDNREASE